MFGIARTTGRPGAAASSAAIVTPAAIESTSACSAERRRRGLEHGRHVCRLHRDDHDVGVADDPRRARGRRAPREERLELVAAVGIDLGDRECRRRRSPRRAARRRGPRPCVRPRAPRCASRSEGTGAGVARARRNRLMDARGPEERSGRFALPRTERHPAPRASPAGARRCRPVHRTDPTGVTQAQGTRRFGTEPDPTWGPGRRRGARRRS